MFERVEIEGLMLWIKTAGRSAFRYCGCNLKNRRIQDVLFHCTEIGCRNDSSPIFGRKIRREIYGKRNFTNTCPVLSGFVRLDDTDIVGWNPPLLTKQKT